MRRLTPDQHRQIAEAYASGDSLRTVGRQFGCHLDTVRTIAKRAGVPMRRQHYQ